MKLQRFWNEQYQMSFSEALVNLLREKSKFLSQAWFQWSIKSNGAYKEITAVFFHILFMKQNQFSILISKNL